MRKAVFILSAVGIAAAAAGATAIVSRPSAGASGDVLESKGYKRLRAAWEKELGRALTQKEARQVGILLEAGIKIGTADPLLGNNIEEAIGLSKTKGVHEAVKVGLALFRLGQPLGEQGQTDERWERNRRILNKADELVEQIESGVI